jgi:hypothetical protein
MHVLKRKNTYKSPKRHRESSGEKEGARLLDLPQRKSTRKFAKSHVRQKYIARRYGAAICDKNRRRRWTALIEPPVLVSGNHQLILLT